MVPAFIIYYVKGAQRKRERDDRVQEGREMRDLMTVTYRWSLAADKPPVDAPATQQEVEVEGEDGGDQLFTLAKKAVIVQ
ncbi:hypothetical protein SAY86_013158 [Trapa natans]|uniref:Uncharacterized protein n=1 Tax=Trapa natans TaxID=22666 RepID=A0AAN7M0V7_TRANT|nr:hypothetical protein SAY86_013158 [Trapa natans]